MLKRINGWLCEKLGYTIAIIDSIDNIETWEVTKYTHIAILKYMGRFEDDNSVKRKIIWKMKIR